MHTIFIVVGIKTQGFYVQYFGSQFHFLFVYWFCSFVCLFVRLFLWFLVFVVIIAIPTKNYMTLQGLIKAFVPFKTTENIESVGVE